MTPGASTSARFHDAESDVQSQPRGQPLACRLPRRRRLRRRLTRPADDARASSRRQTSRAAASRPRARPTRPYGSHASSLILSIAAALFDNDGDVAGRAASVARWRRIRTRRAAALGRGAAEPGVRKNGGGDRRARRAWPSSRRTRPRTVPPTSGVETSRNPAAVASASSPPCQTKWINVQPVTCIQGFIGDLLDVCPAVSGSPPVPLVTSSPPPASA